VPSQSIYPGCELTGDKQISHCWVHSRGKKKQPNKTKQNKRKCNNCCSALLHTCGISRAFMTAEKEYRLCACSFRACAREMTLCSTAARWPTVPVQPRTSTATPSAIRWCLRRKDKIRYNQIRLYCIPSGDICLGHHPQCLQYKIPYKTRVKNK